MTRARGYSRSGALAGFDPEFEGVDVRLVKAHPLRQRILFECTERAASPSELADAWGESRSGVAYHFRVLTDLGAIELVGEERVRGSVKHFYRTVLRPLFEDEQWASVPVELRRSAFAAVIRRIGDDIASAARSNGFDHPETHVSRAPLNLDGEGFAEVTSLLSDVVRRILEIDAEAAERRARGEVDEPPIATELAVLHFHREPPDDA
jgi:DNA-binding transcriptional ArsR family regulator